MSNLINVKKNDWELVVDLDGGRIEELRYKNQIVLGTFERIDGKRGNTHVCVPNFGEEGMKEYNLPFHGPFRSIEWQGDSLFIFAESLGLRVEQEFDLGDSFKHKIRVENRGENDMPVNVAIHNYFKTKNGFEGTRINGRDVSQIIKNDDYIEIKDKNEIEVMDMKRIIFKVDGFNYARLWTGRKQVNGKLIFDKDYICIEPVIGKGDYFGSEESILRVGEKREVFQEIIVGQ